MTPAKSVFRKHKLLVVSGLMGLSAAVVSYASISPFVSTAPVVVAAREIEQYERIEAADLKTVSYPIKALTKGHFDSAQNVTGTYALSRMLAGQIVLKGHVSGGGAVGLSLELERGMRCVFIPAGPERAVGGLIRPGEKVDVVFTPKSGAYTASGTASPDLVVRRLTVLETCLDPSSRSFCGIVALAEESDAEVIAHRLETCALTLLLTPREASVDTEAEAWQPR